MIYAVVNKTFCIYFATRPMAEEFMNKNATGSNGLCVVEIFVLGLEVR